MVVQQVSLKENISPSLTDSHVDLSIEGNAALLDCSISNQMAKPL